MPFHFKQSNLVIASYYSILFYHLTLTIKIASLSADQNEAFNSVSSNPSEQILKISFQFAIKVNIFCCFHFSFADISMPKNEESFLHFESFVENMFFDPFKKPFWIYDQLDTSACCKTRVDGGQWLWLSWQSSRFRLQRSADRIQSSAKLILNVHCQLCWKDENKEKRGQEWPI